MTVYCGAYLAIINIIAFCLYGMDKSAAVKGKSRIPNKVLLGLAVIGGSVGALAGMYTFRHKTKKWYYTITVPAILIIQIVAIVLLLSGCGSKASYQQISQDKAMRMMQEESDYLVVDVRRPDEYAEGHIPGAINIPNETIAEEAETALPDKDQVLLVYCRSGNRSKQASQTLADLGYTNVYEFGGINTWEGDIVTGEQENIAKVAYSMQMKIGDSPVDVTWESNEAVDALAALTAGDWHDDQLSMYGGFEQVGSLGSDLPANDEQTTTEAGDVVLYSGSQIVVFYGSNTWAYTSLGHITDKSQQELEELLGNGDVTISIKTEYSE